MQTITPEYGHVFVFVSIESMMMKDIYFSLLLFFGGEREQNRLSEFYMELMHEMEEH